MTREERAQERTRERTQRGEIEGEREEWNLAGVGVVSELGGLEPEGSRTDLSPCSIIRERD